MVFTFWEGTMPSYLKLCMKTWKFPYTILNYENVKDYTDIVVNDHLKSFTLPQIADVIRVHVLRDQGGYWLDTDTIMLTDKLPSFNIMGHAKTRANTIGYLYTEKDSDMYVQWAAYQDKVLNGNNPFRSWDVMGNKFTDPYIKTHKQVSIGEVKEHWPETYMLPGYGVSRKEQYERFYFRKSYQLQQIHKTDILMLHNSWTPDWYKKLTESEVLQQNCTLSNILREVT